MLRILLVGAEVELAPAEVAGHPAIRATARDQNRKPSEVLLDQNMHGSATSRLPDGKRRGRPDIIHYCLLTILESPACKAGLVEVAIHTRNDLFIRVRSDTRLPRGEARFQGLLAKVLRDGSSQDKDPLIWAEGEMSAEQALAAFAKGPVVRLDEAGAALAPAQIVAKAKGNDLTLILGTFPSGDFPEAWKKAAPEAASIWKEPLNAWAVAGELVAAWRSVHGPN